MSANSNEEIKLSVDHVKLQKTEGTLYLMSERVAWMPKHQNVFTLSHRYEEIKMHKISTETKAKVLLKIIMHDDTHATFHFINPKGQKNQIEDRDKVKELLADLLPKFRQKVSKDLEEKKRILLENPNLYQLYNDLVVTSVVTADEFWNYYAEIPKLKLDASNRNQNLGISQGFISNLRPKNDGSNGVTCNLTFDDKQSIFKTYPSVRQKYIQNVPHKMSEVEFWTKFFQSHYFHRNVNRANDFFADCQGKDTINLDTNTLTPNQTIALYNQKDVNLDDVGYGLTDFAHSKQLMHANDDLIKRYNTYSMRILNAMEDTTEATTNTVDKGQNQLNKILKEKLQPEEEIADLNSAGTDLNANQQLKGSPLYLADVDRYIYGCIKSNDDNLYQINKIDTNNCKKQAATLKSWSLNITNSSNPTIALGILKELSPGGALMNGSQMQNLQEEISKQTQTEMKVLYTSLCELLRHFWACFPPTSPRLEQKFELMKNSLEGFKQTKLDVFREKYGKETWNLTAHLDNMIQVALLRYKRRKMINSNNTD